MCLHSNRLFVFFLFCLLGFAHLSCSGDSSLNPTSSEVGFINRTDNSFSVNIRDGDFIFLRSKGSKETLPYVSGRGYVVANLDANNDTEIFPPSGGITYEIVASGGRWSVRRR